MRRGRVEDNNKANQGDAVVTQRVVWNAVDILPEEVWGIAFSKLDVSADFHAVSQASSVFQRILNPKRTTNLFPAVLELIKAHLSYFEMLACRLVAPSWKHTIDTVALSDPDPELGTNLIRRRHSERKHRYTFISSKDITGFMETFGGHFNNPFVSRFVGFGDFEPRSNEEDDVYWTGVKNLLEKFGTYVWHCTFHLHPKSRTPFSSFLEIWRMISLMTKLRSVEVDLGRWDGDDLEDADEIVEEDLELVELQLATEDLPRLSKHLIRLRLPLLPMQLMDTILDSVRTSKPREIEVLPDVNGFGEGGYDFLDLRKFTRLESLKFQHLGSVSFLPGLFEGLFRWQLTTFHLHEAYFSFINPKISFSKLLKLLSALHNLQDLLIGLSGTLRYDTNSGLDSPALTLKKLRRLEIMTSGDIKLESLHFIRTLTNSLECLHLSFAEYCDIEKPEEVIQFCGFGNRMHESNIWKLFPKLEEITVVRNRISKTFQRNANGAIVSILN